MNSFEQPASQPVNNYLAWSIISLVITLFTCCLCWTIPSLGTAITSLVFSTKVNGAIKAGDFRAAEAASRNAKLWNMITLGLFLAGIIIWCVMFFAGGGMAGQEEAMERLREALEKSR